MNMEDLHKILEKMDQKLDDNHKEMQDKVASIDTTMQLNTNSLVEHIRRTGLLEETIKHTDTEVDTIKTHVVKVQFLASTVKYIGGPGVVVGIIIYIVRLLNGFK